MADDTTDDKQPPVDPRAVTLGTETSPQPPKEPKPDKPSWEFIELGQTRRQLDERNAELQRLQEENRRLAQLAEATARREQPPSESPPYTPPSPPPTNVDIDRQVNERVQQHILNDRAAQLDAGLRADFAEDYQAIINNFGNIEGSMRIMFDDILATGEGPYVAATVGKNPAEIQRLRALPEAQRRMALLKVALEKPKATGAAAQPSLNRPSDAPPPPSPPPRGGGPGLPTGNIDLYDDRFNFPKYYSGAEGMNKELEADETWYAERRRQKLESVGRVWSLRK